jgi:Na+-transporting methylmalonyl-CoA/oxaloacetate decarboxylase gamma subunit
MAELIENAVNLPWGKIMGTLMIRFVGVIIVLVILMISMMILGKVVSKLVEMQEARESSDEPKEASAPALAEEPEIDAGEEEVVAAIGAAIAMAMDMGQTVGASTALADTGAGSWALTGRATQMARRIQGGAQRRS